jgi:hypothetical protein
MRMKNKKITYEPEEITDEAMTAQHEEYTKKKADAHPSHRPVPIEQNFFI